MKKHTAKRSHKKQKIDASMPLLHPDAAGIDIGHREHWCAVPADRCPPPVRAFGTFTQDLEEMARWLQQCGVTTVAMESTGVYWIPAFQILERHGLEVRLVNARHVQNVSGRKTDIQDCQWLQRLHSFGLLNASFRPPDDICVLRAYLRYRDDLVRSRSMQIQHLQKALQQMNVQLHQVLSDVTGVSGTRILEAILQGERDPETLAALADQRVRASKATIQKALTGDYRPEHLFVLQTAYDLYQIYSRKIHLCDEQALAQMAQLPTPKEAPPLPERKAGRKPIQDMVAGTDLRVELHRWAGVDLTAIEGIGVLTAQIILAEIGTDMSRWPSEKHFASWLGLCPDNRISGGQVLSRHTRTVIHPVSDALRRAAVTLQKSRTALGAFFRRMRGKLGAASAITATAHKLARLIYRLLKHGELYVQQGLEEYERKHREQVLRNLQKTAATFGMQLAPKQPLAQGVS
jgi:transposase